MCHLVVILQMSDLSTLEPTKLWVGEDVAHMRKRIPDGFGGDAAEDRLGTVVFFHVLTFVVYEHFTRHRVWDCDRYWYEEWIVRYTKIISQRVHVT